MNTYSVHGKGTIGWYGAAEKLLHQYDRVEGKTLPTSLPHPTKPVRTKQVDFPTSGGVRVNQGSGAALSEKK